MRRYYIEAYCRVCDCEIATKKRPSEYGDYYLVTDVERTMIPRPSEEEARKAVLVLLSAKDSVLYFESVFGVYSDEAEQARDKLTEASNALLRLMGVE